MIGMHYSNNLQTNSVLGGVVHFASSISSSPTDAKGKKEASFATNEHISMLETTRRSPSPSTSTSTLSSLGNGSNSDGCGGSRGSNTGSIVVGSENSTQQGAISVNEHSITAAGGGSAGGGGGGRKEEWVAELQPFSGGVEFGQGGAERFNLGMEDWEGLLFESAGQDQSLLRWLPGDIEDGTFGFKQLLQGGSPNGVVEANVGFEGNDQSSGFEALATGGSSASGNNVNNNNNNNIMLLASLNSSALGLSASGFSPSSDSNGKFGSVPNSLGLNNSINGNLQNPNLSATVDNLLSLPPALGFQQQQQQASFANLDQKPQNLNTQLMVNQLNVQSAASVNFLNPLLCGAQQEGPPAKRHNPGIMNPSSGSQVLKDPALDPIHELLLRKQPLPQMQQPQLGLGQQLNFLPSHPLLEKALMVPKQELVSGDQVGFCQQQQQVLYGELFKATELILTGNFSQAQGILARLNHQLSPKGNPYQRSAFYFKEALQLALLVPNPTTSMQPRIPSPFDGMFKMSAYKALSEASPLIQFMNFTSNQALLEALDDAEHIHIVDFDIGFGAQWSSFMQELPRRTRGAPSSLKITAFSSPSNHHPIEISLMHENLSQFANDVGINFELEVVNFDNFDSRSYPASSFRSSENEAIAVNFPIWSISNHLPILPSLLCFIKQLSPKIIVSMDRGCERVDLPFSHHLLHALQHFEVLMDSIDAANVLSDTANKIERFLFQPKIESLVLGRLYCPDLMPPWRNLFASAGFSPVAFSNFAETQAECIAKGTHVRGFHVEKRQALIMLCWQRRELLTASAWRC